MLSKFIDFLFGELTISVSGYEHGNARVMDVRKRKPHRQRCRDYTIFRFQLVEFLHEVTRWRSHGTLCRGRCQKRELAVCHCGLNLSPHRFVDHFNRFDSPLVSVNMGVGVESDYHVGVLHAVGSDVGVEIKRHHDGTRTDNLTHTGN